MFRVRGESVVEWQLDLLDETDEAKARERALEYVSDMVTLDSFGEIQAEVAGQRDRVFRVNELDPIPAEKPAEEAEGLTVDEIPGESVVVPNDPPDGGAR
jgi:hypothetical protein